MSIPMVQSLPVRLIFQNIRWPCICINQYMWHHFLLHSLGYNLRGHLNLHSYGKCHVQGKQILLLLFTRLKMCLSPNLVEKSNNIYLIWTKNTQYPIYWFASKYASSMLLARSSSFSILPVRLFIIGFLHISHCPITPKWNWPLLLSLPPPKMVSIGRYYKAVAFVKILTYLRLCKHNWELTWMNVPPRRCTKKPIPIDIAPYTTTAITNCTTLLTAKTKNT